MENLNLKKKSKLPNWGNNGVENSLLALENLYDGLHRKIVVLPGPSRLNMVYKSSEKN